jgi:hypothetical protein
LPDALLQEERNKKSISESAELFVTPTKAWNQNAIIDNYYQLKALSGFVTKLQ